jgi:hypothetical protein
MRFSAFAAAAGRVLLQGWWMVAWVGCAANPTAAPPAVVDLFVPRDMRIHPIFTQVADLAGGGKPDGVEAQLEFDDQFGDPTKASGQVLFELFEYRRQPPYTGRRVAGPWVASLATPVEQRDKWNKTLRTYRFPLAYPAISPTQDYVLTATFELSGGGRFFDKRVLTARHADKGAADAKGSPFGL